MDRIDLIIIGRSPDNLTLELLPASNRKENRPMRFYAGIDLHSTNSVLAVLDERDRCVVDERVPNDLGLIGKHLEPYREELEGVVVESTYNWYWLGDGLTRAGYKVHLAHPAGNEQYKGLKYAGDSEDAKWLAHLLRLGLLREGYILEPKRRGVRDLLRRRMHLVQERTRLLVVVGNLMERNVNWRPPSRKLRQVEKAPLWKELGEDQRLAVQTNLRVIECLDEQIDRLEKGIEERVEPDRDLIRIQQVPGIGRVLGWTILLETGPIERFEKAGNYASYCRCVPSERVSNGRRKGRGNRKNGNKYLGWAYMEAAHFAVRHCARARRFHQRLRARRHPFAASKAVANRLAKVCFHLLRDGVPFEVERAFN